MVKTGHSKIFIFFEALHDYFKAQFFCMALSLHHFTDIDNTVGHTSHICKFGNILKGARSRHCSYRCSSHRHLDSEDRILICIELSIKVRAAWPAFAKPADSCR